MSNEYIDGELNFSTNLIEQLKKLHLNSDNSDITFVVDGVKLPAHKTILNMRSSYFEALINGGFSESSKSEIELNVPLEAFEHALRYIYTGQMSLRGMDHETAIDLLGLCEIYFFEELKSGIASHLKNDLTTKNCCDVLGAAHLYELKELKEAALEFMDQNAAEVLKGDEFKTMTTVSLHSLLTRSTFIAPEVEIFKVVIDWRKHNQNIGDDDFETIISAVRFELIDLEDLHSINRESPVLSEKRLLDVIEAKTKTNPSNHRCICKPAINVATAKFNAKVIEGLNPLGLLNANRSSGYTSHLITGSDENCIVVELGNIYKINELSMTLWDEGNRSYSYYVEVSVNKEQWTRVIEHNGFDCSSWQHLYFGAHPVRFIKIVGTDCSTATDYFHVAHLAAYYTETIPTLVKQFISPATSATTKKSFAKVINGGSGSGDTLDVMLDISNYTESRGYAYHTVGGFECIIIRLAQPFCIGSLRLLLWDKDDRRHSFSIKTSTNQRDWRMAVDKRYARLRSCQVFTFEPRPVVFIKVEGTSETKN